MTAYISATADGRSLPPQFVAHRPGRLGAQFVADHDALDGIGHDSAEGASAHSYGYDTVARRHALDATVKLVGAGRALKARSAQAQRTSRHRERSHCQDETAREIGGSIAGTSLGTGGGAAGTVRPVASRRGIDQPERCARVGAGCCWHVPIIARGCDTKGRVPQRVRRRQQ